MAFEKPAFKTKLRKALAYEVIHNTILLENLYNRITLDFGFSITQKTSELG